MTKRARQQKNKKGLLIVGIVSAVVVLGFVIGFFVMRGAVNKVAANVIWDNIYVENVELSGMKKEEAMEALEELETEYKALKIKLVAEKEEKQVKLEDLGFAISNKEQLIDKAMAYGKKGSVFSRYQKMRALQSKSTVLEAEFSVEKKALDKVIKEQFSSMEGAAVDATIRRENGQFIVTESKAGIKVDADASIKMIEEYFGNNWEYKEADKLTLVTTVDEPKITKQDLSQVKDLLGTFSTSFNHTNNRGKNIRNAASRMNGTVLLPGEEMSASDSMGSRNAANGYLEAGSYLNGETVETYGGGVCQVSSTLYNAILLAELEITERHPHSMLVDYVKPSMDAAISEGSKDLKFKNNTDAPIYVEAYTSGGRLTFSIYGKETRSANRTISYEHEVLSTKEPAKKFVASGDAIGTIKKLVSPHTGMKAQLWKVVKENGVQVSKDIVNKSSYSASSGTYGVGTATDNAQAKSIVTSAISTQNEAKINEAIAQAKAVIAAAQTPATPPTEPTTPEEGQTP